MRKPGKATITFECVMPKALHKRMKERAKAERITASELLRRAAHRYLELPRDARRRNGVGASGEPEAPLVVDAQ